jgi:dihydroorotase
MVCIDPHVHLRDWEQSYKETLLHAFEVAWRCGISALFEMPNTAPALTTLEMARRRIADADRAADVLAAASGNPAGAATSAATGTAGRAAPFHGLYLGLTADTDQVRHVVAAHGALFPRVVGFKLYAGHSTGRMGVVTTADQLVVWRTLSEANYRGVVAVHAEREDLVYPERFSLDAPPSHSAARPPLAEVTSVQTQIAFAEATGFRGTLHIVHVTCPETLELIARERDSLPFTLTAAVTPHHVWLDTSHARNVGFLVNPPLRDPARRAALEECLFAEDSAPTWIESDHAPHTWEEKSAGACGLPGLLAMRELADEVHRRLPAARARALTGEAVLEVFGIEPELIPTNPHAHAPLTSEARAALAAEYPWDPYDHFARTS